MSDSYWVFLLAVTRAFVSAKQSAAMLVYWKVGRLDE
jgi:hypothetical protein